MKNNILNEELLNNIREIKIDRNKDMVLFLICITISLSIIALSQLSQFFRRNKTRLQNGVSEEEQFLNQIKPSYGSILPSNKPNDASKPSLVSLKFVKTSEQYNRRLQYLNYLQLIFYIIRLSLEYTEENKIKHPFSLLRSIPELAYWLYITSLCYFNRNFFFLYHIRSLYLISFINDFINLRNKLITLELNNTFFYSFSIQLIRIIIDLVLTLQSFNVSKNLETFNALASKKTVYPSPEPYESVLSIATFSWVAPLLKYGYKYHISSEDVWDLRPDEKTNKLVEKLNQTSKHWSLSFRLLYIFKTDFLFQMVFSLSECMFRLATPILLHEFIELMANSDKSPRFGLSFKEYGFYLVALIFLSEILRSICSSQSLFFGRRVGIRIKSLLTSEIYAKVLRRNVNSVNTDDSKSSSSGKISNLISSDTFETGETCSYFDFLYSIPIQILLLSWYLYTILGWPALVGLFLTFLTIPINYIISKKWEKVQKELMSYSDSRMGVMNELLQGIRIIKFFAWEKQFQNKVDQARNKELRVLITRMIVYITLQAFWYFFPIFITLCTFYAYTKLDNNVLTSTAAFTSLLVFKALRAPLEQLPIMISRFLQAKVSMKRIQKLLDEQETDKDKLISSSLDPSDPVIGFKDVVLHWKGDKSDSGFTLSDLNLSFPPNELSLIIGPTGCGKSSLISGLLGEMTIVKGSVFLPSKKENPNDSADGNFYLNGGVAYVVQSPWLQQDTIRNNILFGEEYDETRYQEVVKCCALIPDFKSLEDGDLTEVGEKGITLSGGQKQRVSLARAVYSRASHIILDDCLSALDAHTAKYVFHNCLLGDLMKSRTRILVTHSVSLTFYHAQYIVVLDSLGKIAASGSVQDVESLPSIKEELAMFDSQGDLNETSITEKEVFDRFEASTYTPLDIKTLKAKKLVLEEEKASGSVKLSVYSCYLKASGDWPYWLGVFLALISSQVFPVVLDWWIKIWASHGDNVSNAKATALSNSIRTGNFHYVFINSFMTVMPNQSAFSSLFMSPEYDLDHYVNIYLLLAVISTAIVVIRGSYVSWGSYKASKSLHDSLLKAILRAPIRFFDTTPVGRLTNRFSKDLENIDKELMSVANVFILQLLSAILIIIVIAFIVPQFLIGAIFISIVFYYVLIFYLRGSREIKRLESISRSPIFSQCDETIQGISTIRAFQQTDRFMKSNYKKIDENAKHNFYLWTANRWLSIYCDLVGGLVVFVTGSLLLVLSDYLSASLVGLAFTYALNFSTHILWIARFFAMVEMNMNSIERIQEYLEVPSEPPSIISNIRPPEEWPSNGKVQINDLVMRYAPDRDPVIKGISLDIKGGEKVGIVGRTGAGKSTLALGFFRFMDAEKGNIVIDDIDIYTIGVYDLRSNLTIIPQDATLFSGTIRSNLDPFDQYDDQQLWNALRRVHIIDDNTANDSNLEDSKDDSNVAIKSLDQVVAENGQNFSQGQRQLLSLARALLKQSKVIIMDEATASVDYTTNAKIQTTIAQEFCNSTILCIAHRLRTIIEYDKVAVMDHGIVKEFDSPSKLLMKHDSLFRAMCLESGDMEFLEQTAQAFLNNN